MPDTIMGIPCGCNNRKEIMFEKGGFGKSNIAVILIPTLLLLGALYVQRRG